MNTQEKLKLLLFDIIYQELNLNEFENKLTSLGIKSKDIENEYNIILTSKYFFLKNEIYLENLNSEELEFINNIVDNNTLDELKINASLIEFLKKNKLKLLISNDNKENYIMWDNDIFHATPADSVVIALNYQSYDMEDSKEDDIIDISNEIENKCNEVGYKVSVILYGDKLINARLV